MQPELRGKLRVRVGLILFLAAAAAVWWGLDRAEPRADWLRVEAPRRSLEGQPLPMRVHLAPMTEPGYLCADLHWSTTRDTSRGYLATGGAKAVGKEGGTIDFEIKIPAGQGVRFVTGIIYWSRTGQWRDQKRVAATELIPVTSNPGDKMETRLEPVRLQPPGDGWREHPRPAPIPRWLTALLFLAATAAAWGAGSSATGAHGVLGPETRWWRTLVVALALACLWELFGVENWLGAWTRAMAHAEDFYYPRAVFQKVVISAGVAATILFPLYIRRARRSRRLLLVSFVLYLAISVVNLVSLHVIDKVADLSWHGLTLAQGLKLGCTVMILPGVRRARRA